MLLPPEESLLPDLDDQLRRSACDRCRCQKLRCERPPVSPPTGGSEAPNSELPTCRRCQRAGAVCTTSFQQRPGRPCLSSDEQRRRSAGPSRRRPSRVNRRGRNLSRVYAPRDSLITTNGFSDSSAVETNRRSSDAATNSITSMPILPQHHETSFTLSPTSHNFSDQVLETGFLPTHGHISGSVDPNNLDVCLNDGAISQDNQQPGFWDLEPDNSLQSWQWSSLIEKSTPTADAPLSDSAAAGANPESMTVTQRPSSGTQEWRDVSGKDERDLCQKLTELSHELCKDVHRVIYPTGGAHQPSDYLENGTTLIERTFRSSEKLRSLLDELRMKASTDQGLRTPSSLQLSHPRSFVGGSANTTADHLGIGTGIGATELPDQRLDMILGLHVATCYVCLNRIIKNTLSGIYSAVSGENDQGGGGSSSQKRGGQQLPRLPGMKMEGLPCDNNDHLRVRLFAEACMHVATGIHKRLETLAADGTMGLGFSRPIGMVLGKGSREQSDIDIRAIKDLCAQISSAIEDKEW
ncbi:hypothetical protein F5Y19DRAFT_443616 [Xylariaceae sp. FL1651]|nr:hypothetical protein F5Y19DRAFT_443616 [Xylariaceae sp. FL1651]